MIACMCVGLITPPVGLNLFVVSSITNQPVHKMFRDTVPFLVALLAAITLIIIFPGISTYLPGIVK